MSMIHDSSEIIVSNSLLVKYTSHPGYAFSYLHSYGDILFFQARCLLSPALNCLYCSHPYSLIGFFFFPSFLPWENTSNVLVSSHFYYWTCLPPSVLHPKWFQEFLWAYFNSNFFFSSFSSRPNDIFSFGLLSCPYGKSLRRGWVQY